MQTKLHYIYDPLCGWCYAAESLLETAIASGSGLYELELHAGGLFQRMHIPAGKRDMIRQSDARISQMTGQIFGDAYLKGLLDNPQTIFDSLPPHCRHPGRGKIAEKPCAFHAQGHSACALP
ncbi:hypothetical protein [Advenella sp. EE-W14]|uniref:hypothetical protein n=1 Tax=Advenella sp. EE-W14 TaxID=2722705 RepID=UPI00145F5EDE|nr:hypothetical protein [Advenella sp. EE-W14]